MGLIENINEQLCSCFLKIEHPEAVIIPESVDDMPPLSRILLSVILKSQPVTRSVLKVSFH